MKPIALALVSAAVAAATSAILVTVMRDRPAAPAAHAAEPGSGSDVMRRLDDIEKTNGALAKSLDDLRMQLDAKQAPARVPVGEIDAAVQRAIATHGVGSDKADATAAKPDAKEDKAVFAKGLFAQFEAGNLSWDERQALWKRAADAGLTDELVAMFEKRANDNPNDPKAQVELGQAYLQKTFQAGGGPEAGVWAIKADKSFDKALSIDDHNWEARFTKGVSLSFWPAALGKQHEAIAQFQTLVEQQDGQTQQPQFAQTHLWLGNMYQQIGEKDKAMAAWQHGLTQFPDDAALLHQIQMAQQH
jgi:tetratricopeptide (TPR) repeat protein